MGSVFSLFQIESLNYHYYTVASIFNSLSTGFLLGLIGKSAFLNYSIIREKKIGLIEGCDDQFCKSPE